MRLTIRSQAELTREFDEWAEEDELDDLIGPLSVDDVDAICTADQDDPDEPLKSIGRLRRQTAR